MRAFVTGLTGFVGPHLARMLAGKGCEVVGLGFRNENPGPAQSFPKGVSVINADVRDYARRPDDGEGGVPERAPACRSRVGVGHGRSYIGAQTSPQRLN